MKPWQLTASEMAFAIRSGERTSTAIVGSCLNRIRAVNDSINAVFQVQTDAALQQAAGADAEIRKGKPVGPLHGVPFTLKDLYDTQGVVTTAGSRVWVDRVPDVDSTVAKRLKAAGAILLGKSNTPELSLSDECNSPVYGRTNNPFNLDRTPGGSSGGAAAIVAAGGVPFDIGSDVGGSVRLPAHFCGVAGFKPTLGRIPITGHTPAYGGVFTAFTHAGPIARSVDDLALLVSVLSGPDYRDPLAVDVPLGDPETVDVRSLRVGWYTDDGKAKVTGICGDVVQESVAALIDQGCTTLETCPIEVAEGGDLLVRHYLYDGSDQLRIFVADWPKDQLGSELVGWLEMGMEQDIAAARETNHRLAAFRQEMTKVWQRADILIAPVAPTVAFEHGDANGTANSWMMQGFNLTGWPVAVVPVGQDASGMPAGVQIVGRPWRDHEVLAVAKIIEQAAGGFVPPELRL
jgi:amidase